jgi:immunity protein 8 of polymorphic toxin system
MRAELKRLHSPDIEDLVSYRPARRDDFGFLLQVMAGPQGQEGEESSDVFVCTPEWFKHNRSRTDIIVGRHHLIVLEYNYQRLVAFLTHCCSESTGESWQEVAQRLGRLGKWEFEDYKPVPQRAD